MKDVGGECLGDWCKVARENDLYLCTINSLIKAIRHYCVDSLDHLISVRCSDRQPNKGDRFSIPDS